MAPQHSIDKPIGIEAGPFTCGTQRIYTENGSQFATEYVLDFFDGVARLNNDITNAIVVRCFKIGVEIKLRQRYPNSTTSFELFLVRSQF